MLLPSHVSSAALASVLFLGNATECGYGRAFAGWGEGWALMSNKVREGSQRSQNANVSSGPSKPAASEGPGSAWRTLAVRTMRRTFVHSFSHSFIHSTNVCRVLGCPRGSALGSLSCHLPQTPPHPAGLPRAGLASSSLSELLTPPLPALANPSPDRQLV